MQNNNINRWDKFIENINKDLKLFLFLLVTICLFRIYFIIYMNGYISEGTNFSDIISAIWNGFRISLKSAGIFAAVPFVFCTLPNLLFKKIDFTKIRLAVASIAMLCLSVLFQARFPYYRAYNSTYGMDAVHGTNESMYDLLVMCIQEYGLIWRLAIAILLTVLGVYFIKKLFDARSIKINISALKLWKKIIIYTITPIICFLFCLFIRFGASFDYEHSINWENAGLTRDKFLNECILDDVQAIYRVCMLKETMEIGNISGVEKDKVREHAVLIANNQIQSDKISDYIAHTAKGAKIPKPKHIFIILGESMSQWPLLDKYSELHVADELKALAKEENSYSTPYFMSNGEFTSVSMTGMITGLCDVGMKVNCQPISFQEVYPTSIAPQFKELGYEVNFWYGGIPSWDNMDNLARAQGFDNYFGMPDFNAPKQSIWGTKDEYLFNAVHEYIKEDGMDFNVIMTTTNHPPYNLNLAEEGFDLETVKKKTAAMPDLDNSEELAIELGHYWYMNKEIVNFIHKTYDKYPDSIFIITGDHAVRTNPSNNPNLFEYKTVPFILYGQGIHQDIMSNTVVGGHMSILPTLMELIAPQGFKYYSLAYSMTDEEHSEASFNSSSWLTNKMIGMNDNDVSENILNKTDGITAVEKAKVENMIKHMRTIAWWLAVNGNDLK